MQLEYPNRTPQVRDMLLSGGDPHVLAVKPFRVMNGFLNPKTCEIHSRRFGRARGGRTHTVLLPGDFKFPGWMSMEYIWGYGVDKSHILGLKLCVASMVSMVSTQYARELHVK